LSTTPRPKRKLIMKTKQLFKATLVALLVSISLTLSYGRAQAISCGDTLGPGGIYTLTTDLTCSNPNGFVLYIAGPVTVNLNGHTLTCMDLNTLGTSFYGTAAKVFNGTVSGCNYGVYINGSKDQVSHVVAQDYRKFGFSVVGPAKIRVDHNTATT